MSVNWVPTAIIRRVCYPTSYRLPPVKRLVFPEGKEAKLAKVYDVQGAFSVSGTRAWTGRTYGLPAPGNTVTVVSHSEGNISNEYYRFFKGSVSKHSTNVICRWCEISMQSSDMRRHLAVGNCKSMLLDIYRKMKRNRKCALCSEITKEHMWGIPLCSTVCCNSWRFSLPASLKFERMVYQAVEEQEE